MENKPLVSVIIPVYNEADNIPIFFATLSKVLSPLAAKYDWEIIFVDDGSRDASVAELRRLTDSRVRIVEFSRNFGKEAALSAGLNQARGNAAIMVDADLQHPLELIPEFLKKWEAGAEVVVGIRKTNRRAGLVKRLGSCVFYKIMRRISAVQIKPNETDFRLVDREVIDAFNGLTETGRMTRALINWLGFKRDYIYFEANDRTNGRAGYGFSKLVALALNSFISLSLLPLKLAGYLGVFIVLAVGLFGFYVFIGKYIFNWAFPSSFSGSAQLALLITFLVGVILSSLGLVALYVAQIHNEILARPLYIIRRKKDR
jgi:dolichol-phosphate mannosyltransferase